MTKLFIIATTIATLATSATAYDNTQQHTATTYIEQIYSDYNTEICPVNVYDADSEDLDIEHCFTQDYNNTLGEMNYLE